MYAGCQERDPRPIIPFRETPDVKRDEHKPPRCEHGESRFAGSDANRAVAVAQAGSPEAALEIVDRLALEDYLYLHSTRAELLRRVGRTDDARAAYVRALELARNASERSFLERRIAEL